MFFFYVLHFLHQFQRHRGVGPFLSGSVRRDLEELLLRLARQCVGQLHAKQQLALVLVPVGGVHAHLLRHRARRRESVEGLRCHLQGALLGRRQLDGHMLQRLGCLVLEGNFRLKDIVLHGV
ncbi:hypothetical protein STCU_10685 [Strigomonas culicis]|uniref:Uncharacterized protein n=1 Tax=Strigomonas culicis TaxID=28005 RepID=S9V3A7_9TRYP|nr:hypothetical protein STCU_10685 [Strigomonas culicis]|eukprot:EPY17325.1 hypothetical protein STCU_10685 [Strigomonas culicis]